MNSMSEQSSHEWLAALQDDELERWPEGQSLDELALMTWRQHLQVAALVRGEAIAAPSSTQRLLDAVRAAQVADGLGENTRSAMPRVAGPSEVRGAGEGYPAPIGLEPRLAAANEPRYAWSWAAAVMLAVGVWAWWPQANPTQNTIVAQEASSPERQANGALAQPAAPLLASEGVLRDPQLDALLQSHRQWGGGAGLVFPAGYVRNVALER